MDFYFIGDPELVTAFRFVGIDGTAVRGPDDVRRVFARITQGKDEETGVVLPMDVPPSRGGAPPGAVCRVLILSEEAADWLGSDLTDWQLSGKYPLVAEIPGILGRLEGRKTLVDSIREVIGIQV